MNAEELLVLNGVNLASTIYQREPDWWTLAQDVAKVVREDDRLQGEFKCIAEEDWTTFRVAITLRHLRCGYPVRSEPLVERNEDKPALWRLTRPGIHVLLA